MISLRYALVNALETLCRMVPLPCKTRLVRIGNPGRQAPVFLTCNYHLTVERVKRALEGMDCYLLVANSRGVNVWCAATGGLLGDHDVISALKLSGIGDLVDHRDVILPQLAAPGVEASNVHHKTGWRILWGPVYAQDIAAFIAGQGHKPPEMHQVHFSWQQRVEMAVAWAFPISIVVLLISAALWRQALVPLLLLSWGLSLALFLCFPLYARWLVPRQRKGKESWLTFERGGLQAILWAVCWLGLLAYAALYDTLTWGFALRWGAATLLLTLLLTADLTGCTPLHKSGLQEDRLLTVVLDPTRCKGAGFCEQVCPRGCFTVDHKSRTAYLSDPARCVRCGACIVQCPFDALHFVDDRGSVIPPQTIRRYKLNLMGKRAVDGVADRGDE